MKSRVSKNSVHLLALAVIGSWLVTATLVAGPLKIKLPRETASFKSGPGAEIANGQCLACHSVEYVESQPPLPRAFWASSVKKMREKFGAQIPEEQIEPLVNYLVGNYGVETNHQVAANMVANSIPTQSASAEALAAKYGCLTCHNLSLKIVGPPYREVAAKYRNDAAAVEKISQQIHKGGSGKWGPVIMPPFLTVSDAEAKILAAWILDQDPPKSATRKKETK